MGGSSADSKDVEVLKEELETSNAKILALEEENAILKEKLAQFVPEEAPSGSLTEVEETTPAPEEEAENQPEEEAPPEEEPNE